MPTDFVISEVVWGYLIDTKPNVQVPSLEYLSGLMIMFGEGEKNFT
jgi:hypothetical protein